MVRLQGPLLSLPYVHAPSIQLESFNTLNKLLYPAEKTLHVAYTRFTETKLNVEFFTKGTTTPDSSFTRVQQLPLHFVFLWHKY